MTPNPLAFPCSTCNAAAGSRCERPGGDKARAPHRARLKAAGVPVPSMGAPRKGKTLQVVVGPEEAARFKESAEDMGLSVSRYLRFRLGLD